MLLLHTPLLALLEVWLVQIHYPGAFVFTEALCDYLCLDLALLSAIEPLNDVGVGLFHLIFMLPKLVALCLVSGQVTAIPLCNSSLTPQT